MMYLVTLVLLSSACLAFAEVPQRVCELGEPFWCSSLSIAKQCGKEAYCRENVWEKQQLLEDKSDVCLFCQSVLSDSKEYLGAGQSEDAVGQFISSSCAILPDWNMVAQCKEQIADFSVVRLLNSDVNINYQLTCSLAGLCKGFPSDEEESSQEESNEIDSYVDQETPQSQTSDLEGIKDSALCSDCTKFFAAIKSLLNNETEALIQDLILQKVCPKFKVYHENCQTIVKTYLPALFNAILNYYKPDGICKKIKLCPRSVTDPADEFIFPELDLDLDLEELDQIFSADILEEPRKCKICHSIASAFHKFFNSTESLNVVKHLIADVVCHKLKHFKHTCEDITEKFLPFIFRRMAKLTDPAVLCKRLRLCKQSVDNDGSLYSRSLGVVDLRDEPSESLAVEPVEAGGWVKCFLCRGVVKVVDHFLKKNKTEQEIVHGMHGVCKIFPFSLKTRCRHFIDKHGMTIIKMLVKKADPRKICAEIRLCPRVSLDTSLDLNSVFDFDLDEILIPGDYFPDQCAACKDTSRFFSSMLNNSDTVIFVQDMTRQMCNIYPKEEMERQMCYLVVSYYVPSWIQRLSDLLASDTMCQTLEFCPSLTFDSVATALTDDQNPWTSETSECALGPEFWCSSEENAKLCKALDYCKFTMQLE